MRKTSIYGLLAAGFVTMLTACAKTEVFDATQYENSQKDAYAANFIKKYGDINPNQTWDFTKGPQLGTRSGDSEGISVELIAGLDFGAMLVAPSNDFYIYPISCQGQWTHDLYVKVGDADPVQVYHKFWTDYTKPYVNGMATSTTIKNGELTVNKRSDMPGVHITAPVGTPVEVYLDKINNGAATSASTATGCAIVINTDVKPEGVPLKDNSVVQYIGMEDRYDYDFDYNDMVMVMVGNPDTPPTIKIENDNYDVKTNITKRYMIEDLGATDDFDFNDIVVDVTENTTVRHRVTYEVGANGERGNLIKDVVYATNKSQKATICHLGGILPFTLKVGNTDFGEMDGQLDKDVKIEKNISGWDPDKNNVSIFCDDRMLVIVENDVAHLQLTGLLFLGTAQ